MPNPSRERFIFGAAIAMLTVYSGILTFGLARVQNNAEKMVADQYKAVASTDQDVQQLMQYLETYHGSSDGANDRAKDLERLKILIEEHEQKLYLLQETMSQLYAAE